MKYVIKLDNEFEVEADSKEEALNVLEEEFGRENTTAEIVFFESCEVIGEDEVKYNI